MKRFGILALKSLIGVLLSGSLLSGILLLSWKKNTDDFLEALLYFAAFFLIFSCYCLLWRKSPPVLFGLVMAWGTVLFWLVFYGWMAHMQEQGVFSAEAFPFLFRWKENVLAVGAVLILWISSLTAASVLLCKKDAAALFFEQKPHRRKLFQRSFAGLFLTTASFFLFFFVLFLIPDDAEGLGFGAVLAIVTFFVACAVILAQCCLWRSVWKLLFSAFGPKGENRFAHLAALSLFLNGMWGYGLLRGTVLSAGRMVLGNSDTEMIFLLLSELCLLILWAFAEAADPIREKKVT